MKQITKRILSMVLSLLILVSLLSVFTFAASNYVPDDEYYDKITKSAVVVNEDWAGLKEGDEVEVSYVFRGKIISEDYDSNIHFSSIQDAYDYCVKMGSQQPIIIVAPGTYTDNLKIKTNVVILGANAGVNPNVKNASNVKSPWTLSERCEETILNAAIEVDKTVVADFETTIDGVKLSINFAYVDINVNEKDSTVVVKNSIVEGAGNASATNVNGITSVFYFAKSATSTNIVKIKDIYVTDMNSTSIVETNVTELTIDGMFYTNSQKPALNSADAAVGISPNYTVTNSMFYDNTAIDGVLNINPSRNDSAARSASYAEVSNCVFLDGPSVNDIDNTISPIVFTVVDVKNVINVHNNIFIGSTEYTVPALKLNYNLAAFSASLKDNIKFNKNKLYGFSYLPDTTGLSSSSRFDYTGNYFATTDGKQHDPIYPASASYNHINLDYFWINESMTHSSADYKIKSTGFTNAKTSHAERIIKVTLDYGTTTNLNITASDSSVKYTLYDSTKNNVVKTIDTTSLVSGEDKNIFYAVGVSNKNPSYKYTYTIVVTTYNPKYVAEFNMKDTYLYSPEAAKLSVGSVVYKTWDGMAYKFTVGKNAFATAAEIIDACDNIPTIILPAGIYTENIVLTDSAILLGAKHGINPNLPQFENPEDGWELNPLRSNSEEESVFEGCVVSVSMYCINPTVVIDGFTFGTGSAFCDKGEGNVTYNTTTLKNIIIDGAGGASWAEDTKNENLNTILSFGGSSTLYRENHKDVRLINLRMTGQGTHYLIGDYYESLLLDGVYTEGNTCTLHKNEWTSSPSQNFYLEIRNSCFYQNITSAYYLLINNSTTNTAQRTSSRVVLDNNIFYNTSTNVNGIFGVRFQGKKDSLKFVNNIFITQTATSIIPGNSNWFLGKSGTDKVTNLDDCEIVSDVVLRFNRFVKCTTAIDTTTCKDGTLFDYSYNYFSSSYSKGATGVAVSKRGGRQAEHAVCDYYYKDWNLTTLNDADDKFAKELAYSITGPGKLNEKALTYTDTVSIDTQTYDFGIKLETRQAKYGIYSDAACTKAVQEPVALVGGKNVFYIQLSSYDGSKSVKYTATITKPFGTEANILRFDNWQVTDTAVNACVPIGTTVFDIPEIEVSPGATYGIYNNAACTSELEGTIKGISTVPTIKYIKVVSEDGKASKVYSLSVAQAVSDQAVLTYVQGANRVSATSYSVTIPSNISSFTLYPVYSENASIKVIDSNLTVAANSQGGYVIDNILSSKTVKIIVTSGSKSVVNTYYLTISKDAMSCEVSSIFNMYNNGDDTSVFETKLNTSTFEVIANLENNNASYAVYYDKACTSVCKNNIVSIKDYNFTAYLKVTSADKSVSKVYTLKFVTTTPDLTAGDELAEKYYTFENATLIEDGVYYIDAADNLSEYVLKLKMLNNANANTTYKAFTDASHTMNLTDEVNNTQQLTVDIVAKTTTVYYRIYVKSGSVNLQSDNVKVIINSKRPVVTYKDTNKMPSWSIKQIQYLNEQGYGYFIGDTNGNFNPTNNISRFEVAAVAVRLLGINEQLYKSVILPFNDDIPNWASNYVKACYKLNIVNGKSQTLFDGQAATTREEFCKIIVSTISILTGETENAVTIYANNQADIDAVYNAKGFADNDKVSNWAKPYVRLAVAKYGVLSGSADNGKLNINPKNDISRQEVAIILANYNGYKAN